MKRIVMLGTAFNTMGGISSVVGVYRDQGMLARKNVRYIATHCDGPWWRKVSIMLHAWAVFIALLLTNQVALAHIHMSSRASFWRKLAFAAPAFGLRVPVIVHLHGSEFSVFYEQECNRLSKRLVRWMFDHASALVVLSAAWKRWARTITVNQNLRVIYNPVMVPANVVAWHQREQGRGLSLGRLGQRKGTFDLLSALGRVKDGGLLVRVALGGDGNVDAVRLAAQRIGVDECVELLGWVRGSAKSVQLNRASFYVLPSHHEGLPMSVLEAMAAGLPIISTPVGGIPEAVTDGVEGFLVEPGDITALADRINQLIRDPVLAHQMGQRARAKVQMVFASGVLVPIVERLYEEILRANGSS